MKKPHDLDWQNIKYFLALARTRSLGKAAAVVGANHVTVSRRVKALEEQLGTRLFDVSTAGHVLTPVGELFAQQCQPVEDRIHHATLQVVGQDASLSGSVRLTTTGSMSRVVLPAVIRDYRAAHPQVQLHVLVGPSFANLSKREADIALRPSSDPPPNVVGRRLGKIPYALFASEDYIHRHAPGDVLSPQEMKRHTYVSFDDSLAHLAARQWFVSTFDNLRDEQVVQCDNLMGSANLIASGVGMGMLPCFVQRALPQLVPVFQPETFVGSDLWVLTHRDLRRSARIKTTMDFISEGVRRSIGEFLA